MWAFLRELAHRADGPCTVIVMDDEYREQPRQFRLYPRAVLWLGGGAVLGLTVLLVGLLVFTPLREIIPGYGTAELRQEARRTALRVAALQDSLAVQQEYMMQLRQLVGGAVGVPEEMPSVAADPALSLSGELGELAAEPTSENWADHEQPAVPVAQLPVAERPVVRSGAVDGRYLSSLQLPAMPPVSGLLTRGFDARTGHYAVDLAVSEGTMVRSIGDGYVILADWTHEGGYALAVQHADGYVSVYKHNQRLLKHVGDRVRAREAGVPEFTTGPHLHFELWNHGLAQDPRLYLVGL